MKSKIRSQKKAQKKIRNSEFFQKFYFLIPWFSLASTIWSGVMLVCFPSLFIKDDQLRWYAILITGLIVLPLAALTFARSYYDEILKNDDHVNMCRKAEALYKELITSFKNIVNKKYKRLTKIIEKNTGQAYVTPCEQISEIFEELQGCLSFLLTSNKNRFSKDDIYINLLYQIDDSPEWILIDPNQEGLAYSQLLTDKSFFTYLLNSKSNYLFYNEKQELLEIDHYIQDERDVRENGKLKGSILGFKFSAINTNKHKLKALLFFSTFSSRFVEPKTEGEDISDSCEIVKENIKNTIIDQFVPRIKIELCHEYIMEQEKSEQVG